MYTKETMWVDNNPGSNKEPMTSAEVKEYYISEFETIAGHDVNELWDKVVMSDNIPNRHDVEVLEQWLNAANIESYDNIVDTLWGEATCDLTENMTSDDMDTDMKVMLIEAKLNEI